MSYLLRLIVPDHPGMLGAVATELGHAGADIISVDIVERGRGYAVDDLVVELPPGRLPDSLISAATSIDGVSVESIRPFSDGPLDTSRELDVVESMAERPADALHALTQALPRIFRAGWALVLARTSSSGLLVDAASPAAPEMSGVLAPWLPLAKAAVLDPEEPWVPASWQNLGTELAAAPLGTPDRAVLLGRPGGPAFRAGEVMRLAHLTGITATVMSAPADPAEQAKQA
ncbi:MAG: ACT domain-containing protein [Actinobacteria bacterium]|nr:ACT domain-containing protein [Actinomycetota bacterium]